MVLLPELMPMPRMIFSLVSRETRVSRFHVKPDGGSVVDRYGNLADSPEIRELLTAGIHELGLQTEPKVVDLLLLHAQLVLEENAVQNLTRITEPVDIVRLHILDSLVAAPIIEQRMPCKVIDIGSGAGYPGIPIALAIGCDITLDDSRSKKAHFLERAVRMLGLSADVTEERAETIASERRQAYDVVLARAVSGLPSLVELSAPLLDASGILVALKANLSEEELRQGDSAARICGLRRVSAKEHRLPGGEEVRRIVVYERVKMPRIVLPRNPGMAQRHPLGK